MAKRIEQPVVDKTREILYSLCRYPLPSTKKDNNNIIVYEQDSYKINLELSNLLAHSSKCAKNTDDNLWTDNSDFGKPEFTIINTKENLVIVIECKVNISKNHISKKTKNENILEKRQSIISKNAVEGALHYAKFLSENYNVIAIGITGDILEDDSVSNLIISTYAWEKGKKWLNSKSGPFLNLKISSLLSYKAYLEAFKKIDVIKNSSIVENELVIARKLNETLHEANVPPIERSLLISGLLLVLKDEVTSASYKNKKVSSEKLLLLLDTSINDALKYLKVADMFKKEMLKTKFKDVFNQQGLLKDDARVLREVLKTLEESVAPYMTGDYSLDIVGNFYSEFLRYAKGDKSSGIVLTPPHITELFCDLLNLNIDDVILDTCAGTAGFLIAGMNRLYSLADKQPDSSGIKEKIRKIQLYGCDNDKQMFALGCSNMILRGDGQANMYYGSCFDHTSQLENKATVGMINPPYSGTNISCLQFVEFMCSCIKHKDEKGNIIGKSRTRGDNLVCAIIPVSYVNSDEYKDQRKKILKNNTLVAVMSMPIDLFRPLNTITCIVLFKAGIPHDVEVPTYLGNWKDDGYTWKRGLGRIPNGNKPTEIKEQWFKSFKRTEENKQIGIWKCLDGEDECCWEKYAETDYSKITKEIFANEVKNFMLYQIKETSFSEFNNNIDIKKWKPFEVLELFDAPIKQCKCKNAGELKAGDEIWYIGAKKKENGLMQKVVKELSLVSKGNCIVMIGDGQGSVGYANYIDKDFIGSTTLYTGYSKYLNKYVGLFLATMFSINRFRYNYGRKWNGDRLKKSEILLPVVLDDNGNPELTNDLKYTPDYELMENYIKTLPVTKKM